MSRKRLVYSSSFKAKVALAAVKQDRTISELASHFKIHPQLVAKWKS
ncbi:MAG: IS3 family transposase, partial [Planctomycetaceae bacterium]|nr:IS3 family transposase [Planctomycetaceae bacterium]